MASNSVKSEKLNLRLPFVAHERLYLSSLTAAVFKLSPEKQGED